MRNALLSLAILTCAAFGASSTLRAAEPPTAAEIAAAGTFTGAVIHVAGRGDIHVSLFPATAPMTVANFVKLAQAKFYDGLSFHRVEPGFVIQGGDPYTREGTGPAQQGMVGSGGPGYTIKAEVNPEKHLAGTLAMADAGLDTAGSQFYLTMAPTPFLDGRYTTFGRVESPKDLEIIRSVKAGDRFTVEIVAKKKD